MVIRFARPCLLLLTLTACSCGDRWTVQYSNVRADCEPYLEWRQWTLECIIGANPYSDEEPEDWIAACRTTGRGLFCPNERKLVAIRKGVAFSSIECEDILEGHGAWLICQEAMVMTND